MPAPPQLQEMLRAALHQNPVAAAQHGIRTGRPTRPAVPLYGEHMKTEGGVDETLCQGSSVQLGTTRHLQVEEPGTELHVLPDA